MDRSQSSSSDEDPTEFTWGTWEKIRPAPGSRPVQRHLHTAISYQDQV